MTTLTDLKLAHRATWASGDYPAVAERIDAVPPRDLLDRLAITPGQDVLDVATGTGNVALRAATRSRRASSRACAAPAATSGSSTGPRPA